MSIAQLGIELRRGTWVALTRRSTEPSPHACSATTQEDKQVTDWAVLLPQGGREGGSERCKCVRRSLGSCYHPGQAFPEEVDTTALGGRWKVEKKADNGAYHSSLSLEGSRISHAL